MSRRFYKQVLVAPTDSGYDVLLDGRVLKTPGKQKLGFQSRTRADLVAAEWDAQGDDICPDTMPCTRLMNVARELTPARRPELCKEFRSYCQTDLLCFRSHNPQDLARRQCEVWQPILDWAGENHRIALAVTTGINAIAQPSAALSAAEHYANTLEDVQLTLLLHFTSTFGSGILALALMEEYLDIDTAYEASRLDEIFQIERWGEDEEAAARIHNIKQELSALSPLIAE